jgi:D-ribose pyranose/furanose isomerase RbsD
MASSGLVETERDRLIRTGAITPFSNLQVTSAFLNCSPNVP